MLVISTIVTFFNLKREGRPSQDRSDMIGCPKMTSNLKELEFKLEFKHYLCILRSRMVVSGDKLKVSSLM